MGMGELAGRFLAVLAGVVFVALAVLLLAGFGSLAQYPFWVRLVFALLVAAYGLWRAWSGVRGSARDRGELT